MTYPAEFAIALEVLDVAHAELGVRLPLDEAGFVTLHLVNAGLASNPQQAIALGKALHDVVAIVERRLGISVEGSTASSTRFLTHVKFVIQRLTRSQAYHGSFDEMFRTFKRENPGIYDCAAEIGSYLEGAFSTHLTEEEHLYLMLHLRRLQDDVAQPGATGPPAGEA